MSASTAATADLQGLADEREKSVGQWTLVWRRLRRHKLAMGGFAVFGLIVLASLLASVIAPYEYDAQDLDRRYQPWFAPGAPGEPTHILGTDELGRDTLTRVLFAGRISLGVALTVTMLASFIGVVVGAVAGALGGWVDVILMRFVDLMLTLPDLPIFLILSSSLRQFVAITDFLGSSASVVIIIGVLVAFGWMVVARLVRGSVLTLREQTFVEACQALGANRARVIFQHLVPNSLAPIIVSATLGFGGVIILESALSFLGFGIMPPVPTWGNMLNAARSAPQTGLTLFIQTLSPGFFIFLTVLCINFIGDGLRDALDPRLKL